ncbi:MAG TPA: hypothetical protein VLG46_17250 [Anaerolineae bacterium]|nr:hypothetical protein [Anaerolineae bacterium]
MRLDELMRAIPPATRAKLPKKLQGFKVATRSWLVQLYYTDPLVHYEVVTLGIKRRELEIGLHFESRHAATNEQLLAGFTRYLFEIKAELGQGFEAEMWDRGWTKVYETFPMETFDEAYVDRVATRLAQVIVFLQPILEELTHRK